MSDEKTTEPTREQLLEDAIRSAKRICDRAFFQIAASLEMAETPYLAATLEALQGFEKSGARTGFPMMGQPN
jgi:hypothetical protein